jgi:hypothetical protein
MLRDSISTGTTLLFAFYHYDTSPRPPLWSSGQSSWLQIQKSGFDFRRYQIFCEVVGLQRALLSLVNTIEEVLERQISGFGLENRDYGVGIRRADHATPPLSARSWQ